MSFKNNMADFATMNVQVSQVKNKVGRYFSIFLCIVFAILAVVLGILFGWIAFLICLGLSALFFGMSKLSKIATKVNQRTIDKIQSMKEPSPNERI